MRVFEWNGSGWTQLGSDIDGDADSYYSGNDVELSGDGTRVAVAGWPQVRVYDFDGTDWTQAGGSLPGGETGIASSTDGRRLAVGFGGSQSHLLVYDWNGDDWIPAGTSPEGADDVKNWGRSPTISADGNRLTATGDDPWWNSVTMTFDWDGSDWVRVGGELTSNAWAISDEGNRLVSIDPVEVFDWNGTTWGEPSSLPSGDRLAALSADAGIVAVGVDSTVVRVYGISEAPPTTTTTTTTIPRALAFEPSTVEPRAATLLHGTGWACISREPPPELGGRPAAITILWEPYFENILQGRLPVEVVAEIGWAVDGEFLVDVTAPSEPGTHTIVAFYSIEGSNVCLGGETADLTVVTPTTSAPEPSTTLATNATLPPTGLSPRSETLLLVAVALTAAGSIALAVRRRTVAGPRER